MVRHIEYFQMAWDVFIRRSEQPTSLSTNGTDESVYGYCLHVNDVCGSETGVEEMQLKNIAKHALWKTR